MKLTMKPTNNDEKFLKDFQIAIIYGDLMILCLFRLLTFVDFTSSFFILHLFCSNSSNFLQTQTIFKKMQKDAISFHSHWLFFKKMELFVVCIFLFIHIIFFIHLGLSAQGYPPGYPPGYLMLPNLTNQFIKLSSGDLQCE